MFESAPRGSGSPERESSARVTCFGCRHLVTLYDPNWRYGCRLFGLSSKMLPSIEVRANSGEECRGYERRAGAG